MPDFQKINDLEGAYDRPEGVNIEPDAVGRTLLCIAEVSMYPPRFYARYCYAVIFKDTSDLPGVATRRNRTSYRLLRQGETL